MNIEWFLLAYFLAVIILTHDMFGMLLKSQCAIIDDKLEKQNFLKERENWLGRDIEQSHN